MSFTPENLAALAHAVETRGRNGLSGRAGVGRVRLAFAANGTKASLGRAQ
jgi:hypothetical protein